MIYTKEELKKRFPGATIGAGASIRQGAIIEQDAVIERGVWVGHGASIGRCARIEQDAVIGHGASIGRCARINTVCSKYVGNISPVNNQVLIRIGCEVHTPEQWLLHGDKLARARGETEWWNETGKAMLGFLISEADLYAKKYLRAKRDNRGRFCK